MSGRNIKAFLDANIIISGLLFDGNEAVLLELGRVKAMELVTNRYILQEVRAVLRRDEFKLSSEEIQGLERYLHKCLTVMENPSRREIINNLDLLNDKKDIPVALGARESGADYLVTGDKELLQKESLNTITTRDPLDQILPSGE
jgi:putative PIN family toxin of toxin-antitoxin system